jgi:hypothetical protein
MYSSNRFSINVNNTLEIIILIVSWYFWWGYLINICIRQSTGDWSLENKFDNL